MNTHRDHISHSRKKGRVGKRGHIFIVSAPSGSGKTTLCRALMEHIPDLLYSVSFTTRPRRNGENEGIDYYFLSKEEFEKGIKEGKWAEFANVHGNYYGTSADILDKGLHSGKDILLDIDVQGAEQILKRYPESVTIFISPPSMDALKQRLEKRGTDSGEVIKRRLKDAEKELARKDVYRHIIENDKLQKAVDDIIAVVKQYR
ncbi:MAG: guanylate kinase [Deltaproteobacteria bacterium]|nr:guanylate kinase [Deltaproteobacteria bacterium]MBW2179390.1 guanylate kinase [Deltaproteobacteria bacterium]MBW2365061.1 guanylate kinase [Deltaproteobacteria bacterium]